MAVVAVVGASTALAMRFQHDSWLTPFELRTHGCPVEHSEADEAYAFDDLATMAATSHVVIHAYVDSVQLGRVYGDPDEAVSFQVRNVNLAVDEVLASQNSAPKEIILEEQGWTSEGDCYIQNGLTWSEVGQEGYYFLRRNVDADTYIHSSSQGRALIEGPTLAVPAPDTELEEVMEQLTPAQLEEEVRQADADVRAGRLESLLSDDFVHHRPDSTSSTRAEWLNAVPAALAPLADTHIEIRHVLADGDHVVMYSRRWLPDAGPGIAVVDIWRFDDGKIAEAWEIIEPVARPATNLVWWEAAER